MRVWREYYRLHKREWMTFLTIFVVMMSFTIFSNTRILVHSASDIELQVNATFADNLESYAGIFSTAVAASVNPTATLMVLSAMGTIENADIYMPNWTWLSRPANVLNQVPFIKTASGLPIANPTAFVLLAVITLVLYLIRSTSASKIISEATADKIEKYGGYIVTVAMSFIPIATSQVVEAAETQVNYVTQATYIGTWILGLVAAVVTSVIYFIVYKCMDAIELIAAAVPVKGMNVLVQLVKAILHGILIIVPIISLPAAVVLSILVVIIAVCLFWKLTTISTYYEYIYVRPIWNKLFHKKEATPFLHKKFPKRGKKRYPELQMAIPAFSMNKHKKLVKKRELVWLVPKDEGAYLLKIRSLRKIKEIPLQSLNIENQPLYLQKTIRFTRILTEDKKVEVIISNEYGERWEQMLSQLQLLDYQIVLDRKKAEKEAVRQEREEKRQQKMDEIGQALTEKKDKLGQTLGNTRNKIVGVFHKTEE